MLAPVGLVLADAAFPVAGLVSLMVTLVIIGVVLYLVTTYIPMPQPIKTVITVIVVLVLCVYLLRWAGLY